MKKMMKFWKYFLVIFVFFCATPLLVNAGTVGFNWEHDFSRNCCEPVGALEMSLDIPATVSPGDSVQISFSGQAVETLYEVPICPTVRYGSNGPGSMGGYLATDPVCFGKNTFGEASPKYFTAPSTPGVYSFCAQGGMSSLAYIVQQGVQCVNYTVLGSTTGTINVSSNIAGASYTITGPATLTGSGVSNSHTSQPTGGYTITWNDVAGYAKPSSDSQTLTSGGTISFSGNYSLIPPPPPVTINVSF